VAAVDIGHLMAIDEHALALLFIAKCSGVSFERTVTLGRQHFVPRLPQMRRVIAAFRARMPDADRFNSTLDDFYTDALFRTLGANQLDSIDAWGHDNATRIMDLNKPIPHDAHGRYTCVVDFGTLEHVFDTAQSFRNLLDLTALGGHVLIATTCINWGGHGFYQFSPEFFFRLFEQNGFENVCVFLAESQMETPWYKVSDPDKIGRRVQFKSDQIILLLAIARRARIVPFVIPIQSDYAALWDGRPPTAPPERRTMTDFARYRIGKNLMKLASALHRAGRRCGGAPLSTWEDREAFNRMRAQDIYL